MADELPPRSEPVTAGPVRLPADEALLVFGAGWIGGQAVHRLPGAVLTEADIADEDAVAAALDEVGPTRVLNAAGKTGHPNVDALEREPAAAYRSNVAGPLLLAGACRRRGIHLTHLSSGCLYTGTNGGRGFAEDDPPNFDGSVYARTKAVAERSLADLGVLQLRLRMPLSRHPHPRNLLTKLLGYDRITRAPNSVTILEDLWPAAEALMARRETGIFNVVNDGVERHDELLALWRERTGDDQEPEVVEVEALGLAAGRSDCLLATDKLHAAGLALPPLEQALPPLLDAYAAAAAEATS